MTAAAAADRLLAARRRGRLSISRAEAHPDVVTELKRRADVMLRADVGAALRVARLAEAAGRKSGDALARATGEHALAKAYHAAGRHARALALYDRVRSAYPDRRDRARVDLARVGALLHLGRFAEAETAARAALTGFRAAGDGVGEAKVRLNLANLRHAQDRHRAALLLLARARGVLAAAGERGLVAAIDLNRANSLSLLGEHGLAGELYAAARRACLELGQDAVVARVDYNRAYDCFLQGRFHDARRLLRAARDAFRRLAQPHGLSLAALDEAEMDLLLNLPRAAASAAAEARAAFLAGGNRVEAARAALFGADAARKAGDERRAAELLDTARREFAAAGHRAGLARADLLRAGSSGLDRARRFAAARRAALAFAAHGLAGKEAMALAVAGGIALERGRGAAGRRLLLAAAARARRQRLREVELRAEHALGRAEAEAGRERAALARYLRALAAYEQLRAGIRSDEDRLAFAADQTPVFEEAIRAALSLGRLELAFSLVERARARALVDLLAADPRFGEAALRGQPEVRRRLARLRRELVQVESRERTSERRAGRLPVELGTALRGIVRRREAALAWLAERAPQASYAVSGRPVVPLEELRSVLGGERALVAYFSDGDRLGALVVTDRDLLPVRGLGSLREIDRALAGFRFALGTARAGHTLPASSRDAAVDAALAPLGELHRLLIAPLVPQLGERALVIVPHARLHLVPYHALARRGQPLLEEREVTTAPSATVLVRAAGRTPSGVDALVVSLADARAPAIEREADAVSGVLGGRRLSGDAATAAALARAVKGARVVHLAMHGVYEPAEPLLSGLELADGRLTLPEVASLELDAALVTLSGCETGIGAASGDEVLGLTRSFLQAGARSLVASLWAVPDTSTAVLMESFYRRLAGGAGIGAALRAAALELRREQPHPYHWAPFVVVGDWGRLYSDRTSPAGRSPSR